MILSDKQILEELGKGSIVIEPFERSCLGSNSYDVHLSKHLAVYDLKPNGGELISSISPVLDAKKRAKLIRFVIPEEGFVLQPGQLYLGSTLEYTETHKHVPFLEGKSSIGRLGIDIHATAGKGDVGFCNHWTLELSVTLPAKVYAGMPIGQLIYFACGEVGTSYKDKASAKYNERSEKPQGSQMFKNF